MTEMNDVPFRYAQEHMVGFLFSWLVIGIDSMIAKADNSLQGHSSMVAENLQWVEKQDEASKPMFEIALKNAAITAIVGE